MGSYETLPPDSRYKYYRLSSEEKKAIIEAIKVFLKERGVAFAIIFGSFVELNSFRDIDIAVYVGRIVANLDLICKMAVDLEERLHVPVDIVPLESIPTKFRHYILTRGKVILEERAGLYEALLMQTLDELALLKGQLLHY